MRQALCQSTSGLLAAALLTLDLTGCAGLVTGKLADTLAAPGSTYSSDDDPELVRDAVPFALKTMEQVAQSEPRHAPLRLALARNFTEYAYAFIQQEADRVEEQDINAARPLRQRAKQLYLRAQRYGLEGLAIRHPHLAQALRQPPSEVQAEALGRATREDVPLLYWTAAPWALALGNNKSDMALLGALPIIEAIMARALALDESYDEGAIHDFYIAYVGGGDAEGEKQARRHLARSLELSHRQKLGPLVSFAENVDVATQNRVEFQHLLEEVVHFDVDRAPTHRLANIVAQRRAHWLLARVGELFAE